MKKIIVTGCAGFIGSHLCDSLLNDDYVILGIDNLNDYYDVSLKKDRLQRLQKFKNFRFNDLDISNKELLAKSFNKFNPNKVVNLAAQAGVRYSIQNPHIYIDTNIVGFLNLIDLSRLNNIEGFIYASSSSVYGGNKTVPFSIKDRVDDPISLYAATKKSNELIANSYSHLYNLPTTGLRFFTVYGPWGRPDMAMFIFIKKILAGDPIPLFNNGNMKRDFTYIDDIISGTRSAIDKNYKCEVFNLGNHKSEDLMEVVKLLEDALGKKAKINFQPMQPGDVKESFADILYSTQKLQFKPTTNVDTGIIKLVEWYKKYYNYS
jgi:UDP-glucuronate 4-epimerase